MRIEALDLEYQQTPQVIASFLVYGPDGSVLVETGPGSTLPVLLSRLEEHGVRSEDVRHVLLTHIHLDHAGAAGWWAQQGATLYVHAVGAPHLVDPSRLLASAERIYGDQMESLWGDVLPAPAERVVAVEDGATIEAGGLDFIALATPGHAGHHHVFRLGDVLFAGDATGIKLPDHFWVDLPAPPPDFDLELWKSTLDRLRREEMTTLYRTHFGAATAIEDELDAFEALMEDATALVQTMLEKGLEEDVMLERYIEAMRARAQSAGVDDETARAYEVANPRHMSVQGIARYLRRRQ